MDTVNPETVGFDANRLRRLDTLIQQYVDRGDVPGALMVVARRGQVAYFNTFGMMDMARQRPTAEDTIYRIYSMTKPITSAAVLMLHEAGHFYLDEPVSAFIPEFADGHVYNPDGDPVPSQQPMTIRHLLTHTAGLSYGFDDTPVDQMYRDAMNPDGRGFNRAVPLKDFIRPLASLPLAHQPGTVWHYSVATDVLGYLVEVVSGLPLDEFFRQRIFEPLGMVDSGFHAPPDKHSRLATLYGAGLVDITAQRSDFTQPTTLFSGGGGLVSTVTDYLRFCMMLRNGGELAGERLLGRKTVAYMTTSHLGPQVNRDALQPGYGFGLGVEVLQDPVAAGRLSSVGEYGWGGLASTHFWIDPLEDIIVIKMTQIIYQDEQGLNVEHRDMNIDLRTTVYQALVD